MNDEVPVSAEPQIVHRAEQPYVAIRGSVPMNDFGPIIERLSEVLEWLDQQHIVPAGPPFFRYTVIDMAGMLEIEAGVPVGPGAVGNTALSGELLFGMLPAGRYATVIHVGHPDQLVDATAALLAWAGDRGLVWDMTPTSAGERWGARLENDLTDPAEEPDLSKWSTELAFRLADQAPGAQSDATTD